MGDYFIGANGVEVSRETLEKYAHFGKDRGDGPLPVDTADKSPNAWGVMHPVGNVWLWRWDYYNEYKIVYPSGHADDPSGPDTGSLRVLRGGSWRNGAAFCRSANRDWYAPSYRGNYFGFRVALSASGIPQPVRQAGQARP